MSNFLALKAYRAKNYTEAFRLWSELAKTNDDQAMTNLGLLYLKGEGVSKDIDISREWFLKGAAFGNDSANYNLALMYQSAIGVAEDTKKAIEYFREAVKKGHQNASFRLGLLLLKERSDKDLAKEGFEAMLQAALGGHPVAVTQMGGVVKQEETYEHNQKFRDKSPQEQRAIIDDALTRYIRPILAKDGGDIELLEYIATPNIELRLLYLGSCAGCSLGATSTYGLIKNTLVQVIDGDIAIYVI